MKAKNIELGFCGKRKTTSNKLRFCSEKGKFNNKLNILRKKERNYKLRYIYK